MACSPGNTSFFSRREMSDGVATERYQAGDVIGIDATFGEIAFVQTHHAGQVAAGRMARYERSGSPPYRSMFLKVHATAVAASSM